MKKVSIHVLLLLLVITLFASDIITIVFKASLRRRVSVA
jgi:hypothetical protein